MFFLEIAVISFSIFVIFSLKLIDKNPPPILNVYQRPNGLFWLKVAFMYTILSLRQRIHNIKKSLGKVDNEKDFAQLDKPQKLSQHPNAIDAVYFNGANKNGDYFVVGTARRKNRLIDGFFYLVVEDSNLGVLESPKLPCTELYQNEELEEYAAEGIRVTPLQPMKKWRIQYSGKMKEHKDRSKLHDVEVDVEWTSNSPYFNFDTDMHPLAMAKSMAYERWSKEYFNNLKMNHQTHYEQHGDINGIAKIDGKVYKLSINAVRDHSFGLKREWRQFHRYALHFFSAENGDRFHVGAICMPVSFSRFILGYVYRADEKKIYPVKSCDLQLYQHGESGNPPNDYAFNFEAGGKKYSAQVNVIHAPHFYISKDWESKVVERLCTYEINGLKGWGAAEWQYRNIYEKQVPDFEEYSKS